VPSLRRDAGCLDPSAPYASGLGRRTCRGARGGPADHARLVRATRGTKRLGARALEGVLHWEGARVGADGEASGPGAGAAARCRRSRRGAACAFSVGDYSVCPCSNALNSKKL
jgi:hypothetical protein